MALKSKMQGLRVELDKANDQLEDKNREFEAEKESRTQVYVEGRRVWLIIATDHNGPRRTAAKADWGTTDRQERQPRETEAHETVMKCEGISCQKLHTWS